MEIYREESENMDIDVNPLTPMSDQERISRNSVV